MKLIIRHLIKTIRILWNLLFEIPYIGIIIGGFLLVSTFFVKQCYNQKSNYIVDNKREVFKILKPENVIYKKIVQDKKFENLKMLGSVSQYGVQGGINAKLLRTLRFQNISRKVEKKYNLPDNLILAMVMQETGGADLLPNSSDDGGIGLCHMQPVMAKMFGLKTYKNCNELRCFKHGKELRQLINKHKNDIKILIEYDERFNPVLNFDAAGRMLAYYMAGKQYQSTPVKTAIYGYAGSINYSKYYKNVKKNLDLLNSKSTIRSVKKAFNKLNSSLIINGKKSNFDDYIKAHHELNRNYGLDNY